MAPFTNLFGEVSPDSAIVTLVVKPGPTETTEQLVRVEIRRGGKPETLQPSDFAQDVPPVLQSLDPIDPTASPQPPGATSVDTLRKAHHSILFMDVGRWGGPAPATGKVVGPRQRDFGIVAGPRAALCEFAPPTTAIPPEEFLILDAAGKPVDTPINTLLTAMRKAGGAVRIMRHGISTNPNTMRGWIQDQTTVHVILPDLHLPICTSKPSPSTDDGHHMGRFEYTKHPPDMPGRPDDHGMTRGPLGTGPRVLGSAALTWFDRYLAGDIFGHGDGEAARDLIRFLDVLEAVTLPPPLELHFTQLGDLYDLWIGLDLYFSRQPTHSVVLRNLSGVLAGDFIDFWCRRTEDAMMPPGGDARRNVVSRLNALSLGSRIGSTWLFGNHDNYLAAHTAQRAGGGNLFAPRTALLSKGGTRIEHGQRGDPSNRDGAIQGQLITNGVFAQPILRKFDPDRRQLYLALAATTYATKPDFHVFVMGHTHSPFLTNLRLRTTERTFL